MDLEKTFRLSPFAAGIARARPQRVAELESRGAAPWTAGEMRAELGGGEDFEMRVRALRERVMLTLAHRDLNGLAPLDEVLATMTALADECIAGAAAEATRRAVAAHGEPANGDALIVVGLGKLGGGELNVSSDVDLVFLHQGEGTTSGPRPLTHHEFFSAAGRILIALLSEVTADGWAFRVDMRLRPMGEGPLVASLAALEDYFITHARPWERFAWLKSRVVAGPAQGVRERVDPFVYRRYLDYGMLEAMRDMHGRIFEAATRRGKADDIKVGAGGIRAIEFAVQLFQMVRGGRDPGLRIASTRGALAALAARGLFEAKDAQALGSAYEFLRRLEHRLQYYDDQQTQALPRDAGHRALIAESMGFAGWDPLYAQIEAHRANVRRVFDALFEAPRHETGARISSWLADPQAAPDAEGLAEDLREAGIVDAAPLAARLIEYTRSRRYRGLSSSVRAKVDKLLPRIVEAAAAEGGGEAAGTRLMALLEAIDGREAYHSLLLEFPQVLARAARIMARSAWAARLLARHPILLDELTRSAASFTATDWPAERAQLLADCAALSPDVEHLLDHLRHFKQRHMLRFTIADLEGELPVMALSDELSALADSILEATLASAAPTVEMGVEGFCIVGYGKLGGKELGYGSDLDIIFLYDESRGPETVKLPRLAQRINTWLTSVTPAGVLYETDLRLRPDGATGLLVSSMAGFRDYQMKRAWTWEHQALTRARFAAGDAALGARFEQVRDEVLALPRDAAKLFGEIAAMRARMRQQQRSQAGDVKHAPGGVIDLEFAVQALVLAHAAAHPALRENKGNHTLLNRMGALGLVDARVAADAADAYLAMRRRLHEAALNDEDTVQLAPGDLEAERAAVLRLWEAVFGEATPRSRPAPAPR
ncbi:MAG TPA: bifunctional [glutamate--ammonia ligase]-adenylyl-L-tyrosine phosphorylase/[glutamate--ammonia-ligase] adenylyltransferase [Usitatibacter sp.]|nr:bifunctional [glutamate--ammonia ligase]-adenylyl-L-tyrosine phosphorylase/[glutamate--ammonia-ligase] adenylyltransferase [Usitatibacter sp.]